MFVEARVSCMILMGVAGATLLAATAGAVTIEYVPVGDPGNVDDTHFSGYGGVDYVYLIGKYEVTNDQHAEFLNHVAIVDDPHELYNTIMAGSNNTGGILRSGSGTVSDPWVYSAWDNRGRRPVNHVSWYDALRFANWLHNGQPAGRQNDRTTEDGAYDMSLGKYAVRKAGAQVFLPGEDEWCKAAYYKGGGTNAGYWDYPTQSDSPPSSEVPPGTDMTYGSANCSYYGFVDSTYFTTTTEVGAFDAKPSESAYGTYDQGGNVQEWLESPSLYRGGSYAQGSGAMKASVRGVVYDPIYENPTIGFRVACVIPEPGGLVLLTCGAMMGLFRRRRGTGRG